MGSKSDYPIVDPAIKKLEGYGQIPVVRVLSAHRTPEEVAEFAKGAREFDIGVIIAAAGKAAALPGCIAALTTIPVIGLPIKSSFMDGLDSLLSMVMMPSGMPVATVGTNAAENAAILALQMLSIEDREAQSILENERIKMKKTVLEADESMR